MERWSGITCLLQILLIIFFGQFAAFGYFEEVHVLIEAGDYPAAIDKLEALSESAQENAVKSWCYYQMGEIYYNNTHEYRQAVAAYDKILQLEEKGLAAEEIFLAIIKKGDVYSRMGNYADAIQTYDRLIKLAPASHFVHKTGLQKIRDINNALADLREQRRIAVQYKGTPLGAVAEFQIAELYREPSRLNRPRKAIEQYESVLAAYPEAAVAPEARWRIAHVRHTVFKESLLAIATYRKVTNDYPTSNFAAEALYQIATIHRTTGKYSLAIPVFEKLRENYPNFWNMHAVVYWMGVCYEKTLNYPKAIEAFETFLHAYLPHLDPGYLGQISMHDKGVPEVSRELRRKLEDLGERMPETELERLETALAAGDFSVALGTARNLIATAPRSRQAKRALPYLLRLEHLSRIEALQERLGNKVLVPVEASRARLEIGRIYEERLGEYEKAVEVYKEVWEHHGESTAAAEALYRSGILYGEHLSAPKEALAAYERVIAAHPNTYEAMMAHFQLGELYRKGDRYPEALAAYKQVIGYPERARYLAGGYKDSFSDRAAFRIGRVQYEGARYSEARFAFEAFIEKRLQSPRLAAAYMYLAAINEKQAETAQAAYFYRRAEERLRESPVEMESLREEAGRLEIRDAPDSEAVLRFLKDRVKRLKMR